MFAPIKLIEMKISRIAGLVFFGLMILAFPLAFGCLWGDQTLTTPLYVLNAIVLGICFTVAFFAAAAVFFQNSATAKRSYILHG